VTRLAAAICILALATTVWAGYGPPLDLPNAEMTADPAIIKVDDVYYLYVTASTIDFECWSSTDLDTWVYEGVVWENPGAQAWNHVDLWAPEVHRDGDDFYLYYAADMRIGVARADNPLGPFVDVFDHPFVGNGYNGVAGLAIDAHVFVDNDGRRYFYYAGYAPFSVIRVAEMADMTTLVGEHRTVVEPGILNWELFVTEAPWMVEHEGTCYLMYSGYGADRPSYAVGYATADNPMGSFDEFSGNPILHRDDAAAFYGPGHNCVITAPDGSLKIVYHTKVEQTVGWDRRIRINDLCFTTDGEMYIGFDGCNIDDDDDVADDDTVQVDDDTDENSVDDDDDDDDDNDDGCGC